ncbi:MAG: hypothetical protein U9N33_00435 [Campylobacterota bacterium]|nr:hypothetical protein [Campylobacterota bacterium]
MKEFKTVERLTQEKQKLIEVELMLTPEELKTFATYCIENDIKFNDWIRKLAYKNML